MTNNGRMNDLETKKLEKPIKEASLVGMRQSVIVAEEFKKAGIVFVPIPVKNVNDHIALNLELMKRLEEMAERAERTE